MNSAGRAPARDRRRAGAARRSPGAPAARPSPAHARRQPRHHRQARRGKARRRHRGELHRAGSRGRVARARRRGHVVAPEARPLERVLGPELGDFVKSVHEEHGVRFHLGETVAASTPTPCVLSEGEPLAPTWSSSASACGPAVDSPRRPGWRSTAASWSTITCAPARRAFTRRATSRAIPTRSAGEHVRIEHWAVAQRRGRWRRATCWARRVPFASRPFFWSAHYDVTISYVGHAESWDRIDVSRQPRRPRRHHRLPSRRTALAVATIGRDKTSLEAELALEAGDVPLARLRPHALRPRRHTCPPRFLPLLFTRSQRGEQLRRRSACASPNSISVLSL